MDRMKDELEDAPLAEAKTGRKEYKEYLIEVTVFLILIVPSMLISFFALKEAAVSFLLVASSAIVRDTGLMCLVLFFAWRNGEPFGLFGWTKKNLWQDISIGVLLFIPFTGGIGYLEGALRRAGLSAPAGVPKFLQPSGKAETLLALALVTIVAIAEEGIFRGYLIRRFNSITGSVPAAIVISSAVFSLGHGYEGGAGLVTVAVTGAVLAIIYLWRKSLTAPIVLHFLQDFVSIVVSRIF